MDKIIKWIKPMALLLSILSITFKAKAQDQEVQQLLLNIEKLTQFKAILSDMKKGYQIYQQGYGMISGLSKGNFDLHNIYLNGLLAVSPAVRNNPKVRQIIDQQQGVVVEYRRYKQLLRRSGSFSASEINYIDNVLAQLLEQSKVNVDDLGSVTTPNKFRMSDDDRLRAIDRISINSSDQLQFLRWFNRKAIMLSISRSRDLRNTQMLKRLYGIN